MTSQMTWILLGLMNPMHMQGNILECGTSIITHYLMVGMILSTCPIQPLTISMQELRVIVMVIIYHLTLHPLQTHLPFQMTTVPMKAGKLFTSLNFYIVANRCQV